MDPSAVTPELARYCFDNWDTVPSCKGVPLFGYCVLNAPNDPEFCDPDLLGNYYGYRLDFAAYAAFLALFAASLVAFVLTYAFTRRGLAFGVAYSLGCVAEVLGYAGRVISSKNQWNENGFLIQICCLTFGPAFMAAGNYLCLRRIVYAFGKENSRIAPEWYTRVVCCCLPPCHSRPYRLNPRLGSKLTLPLPRRSSSPAICSRSCCRHWVAAWLRWPRTTTATSSRATTS